MTPLLILLAVGLMCSYILRRDIEAVFPPFLMTVMLGIYALGILKKSHHAYSLSLCAFALIAVVFACRFIKDWRSEHYTIRTFSKLCITKLKEHTGFLIYLLVCALAIRCYSTHFVLVWDDFHYNATFPKDCFYYGTMPTGIHSATHYKSYLPLQQLFFYWGFQGSGFSEPMMFQYKMVLIYTLLLPFFRKIGNMKGWIKAAAVAVPVCLPFLYMYEVQESLSMDMVIAGFFGYALIGILYEENRDALNLYGICASLVCLTLMKTISPAFTAICLFAWFVVIVDEHRRNKTPLIGKESIWWLLTCLLSAGAYLSWNIFCRLNGNSTYLARNLAANVENGTAVPAYASETIRNMIKSIATMHLNLGDRGLSLLATIIFAALILIVLASAKLFERKDAIAAVSLVLGFIGYFAVLCYTYVFVFEQWEAEELSSLDRYLGTYATVICAVFMFRFMMKAQGPKTGRIELTLAAAVIILLATLPYSSLLNVLIPSRYIPARQEIYDERRVSAAEAEPVMSAGLRQGIIMVINDKGNTVYSRSLDYELIPHIADEFDVCDHDEKSRVDDMHARLLDVRPDYVYFTVREREFEDISVYTLPDEYVPVEGIEGLFERS